MTRFAQGTDPEYIKKVNDAMYGKGKENEEVRQELLKEAEEIREENELKEQGSNVITAGISGNKTILFLLIGGVVLYYLNKQGFFKKLLK